MVAGGIIGGPLIKPESLSRNASAARFQSRQRLLPAVMFVPDVPRGTSGTLCELPKRSPHLTRQNERCHENASDCLRLDRCGGAAGDASTCLLLTRLPSRRTMPGVLRSVPPILRSAAAILWSIALLCSAPAILWSIALLCSAPAILRLRLGQPNHSVILALLTVLT